MFKDFNCCSPLSFGVFSHSQCRSWDKLQMFVFCSFRGPNGFHLRKGSLEEGFSQLVFCTFVSRFPAVVSGANGRVPPTALRLFLSSAVVWNKWLLLQKSFFGWLSQLFCTFCSPFSLLDSMLCFFKLSTSTLQKKAQKHRPGSEAISA